MKDKIFTVSILFMLGTRLELVNYIVPAKNEEDALDVALKWDISLPLLKKGYQVFISFAGEIGGWACPQNKNSAVSYNTSAQILSIRTDSLSAEAIERILSEVELNSLERKEIFSAIVEGKNQ